MELKFKLSSLITSWKLKIYLYITTDLTNFQIHIFYISIFFQGSNSVFNIELLDDSGIFSVEPNLATGSTSVSIRVSNGPLDYENPNQRKYILLVSLKLLIILLGS